MSMDYLNFGDALSPIMVALLTGMTPVRVPTKSKATRLAAVGTIAHGFELGETWFWGTGCSKYVNPSASLEERVPFKLPENTKFVVTATRGPVSEALIAGETGHKPGVYGDPVWLLPRFYRPQVERKWKLGVVLHLSELADRSFVATPREALLRHVVPEELRDQVHLITTCTPISASALGEKIDEFLQCERIVSTSLHGMVIAESYGIPCLYFSPNGPEPGAKTVELDPEGPLDLRIVDLYRGLGKTKIVVYGQPRHVKTDWQNVIEAIDQNWAAVSLDEQRLKEALPLPLKPVVPEPGKTIWDHPVIQSIKFQHDVKDVVEAGKIASKEHASSPFLNRLPQSKERQKQERLSRLVAEHGSVPLSFVASHKGMPFANLGDALSAVVVSALSGLPIKHTHFDAPTERLVSVGTIGQAQKFGELHVWGTGFDAGRNAVDPDLKGFLRPPETQFHVHATRGPDSARTLTEVGIEVSGVYGDPVALLDRIWPMRGVEKTHELGVVAHISELTALTPESSVRPELRRYDISDTTSSQVKVINTLTHPTVDGLQSTLREILSCKAILSTSLHGLVIAETYGIPCAWFGNSAGGDAKLVEFDSGEAAVDHRMKDFYSGAGARGLLTFNQERNAGTDWDAAIVFLNEIWEPLRFDPTDLASAFPLPVAPQDEYGNWFLTEAAAKSLPL